MILGSGYGGGSASSGNLPSRDRQPRTSCSSAQPLLPTPMTQLAATGGVHRWRAPCLSSRLVAFAGTCLGSICARNRMREARTLYAIQLALGWVVAFHPRLITASALVVRSCISLPTWLCVPQQILTNCNATFVNSSDKVRALLRHYSYSLCRGLRRLQPPRPTPLYHANERPDRKSYLINTVQTRLNPIACFGGTAVRIPRKNCTPSLLGILTVYFSFHVRLILARSALVSLTTQRS